jgi:hypothetical protein
MNFIESFYYPGTGLVRMQKSAEAICLEINGGTRQRAQLQQGIL